MVPGCTASVQHEVAVQCSIASGTGHSEKGWWIRWIVDLIHFDKIYVPATQGT